MDRLKSEENGSTLRWTSYIPSGYIPVHYTGTEVNQKECSEFAGLERQNLKPTDMSAIANMPYRKRLWELNLVFYLQSFLKVTSYSSILWPEKSKMSWQGAKSLRRNSYSLQMKKSWRLKFRAWKSRESYEAVQSFSWNRFVDMLQE